MPPQSPTQPATSKTAPAAAASALPIPIPDRVTPQFTLRAVLTGMALGALLSACNIYTGLKVGAGFNMSITAALLGYGFWLAMQKGARVRTFSILESNISQTAASSAAAVSSAGLVAPIPALTMITGQRLDYFFLALWVFSVCCVGITVGIALRRQMVIHAGLPFPGGIATLEMLRELYARGREALRRIAALGLSALSAAILLIMHEFGWLASLRLPGVVKGVSLKSLGFALNPTGLMYAVGGLIGLRAGVSLLVGALLAWGVLAPVMIDRGAIRLSVRESLADLPAGIELPSPPAGYLRYDAGHTRLVYEGVMSEAERDSLLAASSEPPWQEAIWRLFVRSQRDPAVAERFSDHLRSSQALGTPPTAALPPPFQYDPASRRLNLTGALFEADAAALRERAVAAPAEAAAAMRALIAAHERPKGSFREAVVWLLWPGAALMVVASLTSVAFSWRSMLNAFRGGVGASAEEAEEVSWRWIVIGLLASLVLSVALQVALFRIIWWAALLGVLLTFVLAMVACRVAGETNTTPVGAMGKVTQLFFGALLPGQAAPNLMAANVTGGAASQCADLMFDYKTGLHLGASPRWQSLAQLGGALAGSIVGSGVYLILIRDPARDLMTDKWAAPAVAAWKAVAELFLAGFEAMPEGAGVAILIASIAGVVLAALEQLAPGKMRRFMLSPAAMGLAFVVPMESCLAMFLGAAAVALLGVMFKSWATRFAVTICAGVIAGESLTGVGIAVTQIFAQ